MKLKILIVDLELSPRAKKLLIRIGVPLAVLLGGATLANAGNWTLPHQWSAPGHPNYAGANLNASDLDDNFAALADAGASLDARIATLEAASDASAPVPMKSQEVVSNVIQIGSLSSDLIYTGMSLTLQPGTWIIEAFASVGTTDIADGIDIGLYNVTTGADVLDSRSGIGVTVPGNPVAPQNPLALHTTKILSFATPMTFQLKAYRNGTSTLLFGTGYSALAHAQRMLALQLR